MKRKSNKSKELVLNTIKNEKYEYCYNDVDLENYSIEYWMFIYKDFKIKFTLMNHILEVFFNNGKYLELYSKEIWNIFREIIQHRNNDIA